MQNDQDFLERHHILNKEDAKRAHDLNRQISADARRSAATSANELIRALLLVNGGAVVTLLAFSGAIASQDAEIGTKVQGIIGAVRWFAFGVGAAAVAAAFGYLVNAIDSDLADEVELTWEYPYVKETGRYHWFRPMRHFYMISAVVASVTSLGFFFYGVFSVIEAVLEGGG